MTVIGRKEMLAQLRAVDPRFDEAALSFLAEWENDPISKKDGLPHYLYISELTPLIVEDIKAGNEEVLRPIFGLIERLIVDGDRYVSEIGVVGLLEGIQSNLMAIQLPLESAHPYLLGESRQYWDRLIEFWNTVDGE